MGQPIKYNGFRPKVTLKDGRVIHDESELRPEERIIRLEKDLEAEETQAEAFLKFAPQPVSMDVRSVCICILTEAWRQEPLAVIAYLRIYREKLIINNCSGAIPFLEEFYKQLFRIFQSCGLIERGCYE